MLEFKLSGCKQHESIAFKSWIGVYSGCVYDSNSFLGTAYFSSVFHHVLGSIMGAQGTATIDFGSFPGSSDASVTVTGQASILGSSLVEAWIFPASTTDHTADEHMVETIKVFAHSIVAGTGFTISAFNTSEKTEPLEPKSPSRSGNTAGVRSSGGLPSIGGKGTRIYGQWQVAWVWN